MKGFLIMLKANLKLLLRNKGYLVCVLLVPILAVIEMNISGNFGSMDSNSKYEIMTWNDNENIIDMDNSRVCIKVYDRSNTKESKDLLDKLVKTGFYKLYLVNEEKVATKKTYEEIEKKAGSLLESSSIKAIVYIPEEFKDILTKENNNFGEAVKIIRGYEDDRIAILQSDIDWYCSCIRQASVDSTFEEQSNQVQLNKKVMVINQGKSNALDEKEQQYRSLIGYAIVFLTVSFIFSGVFVVGIIIKERDNNTYYRLRLSRMSNLNYIAVKIVLIVITTIIQVGVFDVGLRISGHTKFGVPYVGFLAMIFLLGILFNAISLVIGLLVTNLLGVTFLSFTVWSASSLMAGLYFPVASGSTLEKIAMFTPQRWVIISSEMYKTNTSGTFTKFFLIFCAFLFVVLTIGMVALKKNEKE